MKRPYRPPQVRSVSASACVGCGREGQSLSGGVCATCERAAAAYPSSPLAHRVRAARAKVKERST